MAVQFQLERIENTVQLLLLITTLLTDIGLRGIVTLFGIFMKS